MKKINFVNAQQVLSKKEMKNVLGGSSSSNLCDGRKSCKTRSDCGSGQLCISSHGKYCCY